jgi:hypothetical protein
MSENSKDYQGEQPPKSPPNKNAALLLLGDIADVTWRMFVPSIGMIVLGLWADSLANTLPLLTIVGMVIGLGITALLVQRMVKKL